MESKVELAGEHAQKVNSMEHSAAVQFVFQIVQHCQLPLCCVGASFWTCSQEINHHKDFQKSQEHKNAVTGAARPERHSGKWPLC